MIFFFFFNDTPTTEIYTLSLHDALPIGPNNRMPAIVDHDPQGGGAPIAVFESRSEEHTSELQSRENLVCRLLLEKKKKKKTDEEAERCKNEREGRQRGERHNNGGDESWV